MHGGLGIYIHVPFCAVKCGYCSFCSFPYTSSAAAGFVDAVIRNLKHYSDKGRPVDSVYFGGGTPSLLRAGQIEDIMSELHRSFVLSENAEVTLEANPGTLSRDRINGYLSAGINRLSIGVQSLDDEELKLLGRTHSAERAVKAVYEAADCGFSNISCDIMLALPGQTTDQLDKTISGLTELPLQHISAYILKIEDGTAFFSRGVQRLLPSDELTAEMYLHMVRRLGESGFQQYEVSNFSLPGYESRHNCRYWMLEDYIGIGPSAHSCCYGRRFAVPDDIEDFTKSNAQREYITEDTPGTAEERIMLSLRLRSGLQLSMLDDEDRERIEKKLPALENAGYCVRNSDNISLTPEGFLVSNSVISYLL
ncbi:MAG: radical SAM family heme chaperone HemW [Ruminococcus sp.]|nr:radical SAM family heme chaperone HemW [Ruminococcus sp.]